eukprot:5886548-Amphidinium_carterae.1
MPLLGENDRSKISDKIYALCLLLMSALYSQGGQLALATHLNVEEGYRLDELKHAMQWPSPFHSDERDDSQLLDDSDKLAQGRSNENEGELWSLPLGAVKQTVRNDGAQQADEERQRRDQVVCIRAFRARTVRVRYHTCQYETKPRTSLPFADYIHSPDV